MSPPGPPHPHPQGGHQRYRHGSGHSEQEEGGPSVQYTGNYYGERDYREGVMISDDTQIASSWRNTDWRGRERGTGSPPQNAGMITMEVS